MPTKLRRNPVSAARPYAVIDEQEADRDGTTAAVRTIFLTASECPIGCSMCDLWQNTLESATPRGAIPAQIDAALADRSTAASGPRWLKLYNSGNFFDPRSIPPADYAAIAGRCRTFSRVIVENHPRFGRQRLPRFRDLLAGRLEVAVGLETVQPRWLTRLGKQMSRDDFDAYARWLGEQDTDLRVFLIIGVPQITAREAIRWARLSARHAVKVGARHISLIPARSGHGWNGASASLAQLSTEQLLDLQNQILRDITGQAVLTVDTWDLKTSAASESDKRLRSAIQRANLSQQTA
jgi:radical SAM enzyme (TIGR01210 family)